MALATPYPKTAQLRQWIGRFKSYDTFEGEPTTVSLYELWQQYGGPEEGGWYYECGAPIKCICIFNKKQAIKAALQLQQEARELFEDETDNYGWPTYSIEFDQKYAAPYPQRKPHYC